MRFLALTDFKARAGISGSTNDSLLVGLLDAVSARMQTSVGRTLRKAAYTETVKPIGRHVSVKAYPIDTAQSLVVTDYNAVVPSTDYVVDAESGTLQMIWRPFVYEHFPSVTIAYTGGYTESGAGNEQALAVPDDLKDACAKQVNYEFQNRDKFGQQSVSMDGSSVSLAPAEWLPMVKQILQEHRRMSL